MRESIGMVELSSIGIGYDVEDAMLKAAAVELIVARTICSGKYIVIIAGDVGAVESSVRAGLDTAGDAVIDHLVIPNVHPSIFNAIPGTVTIAPEDRKALGIIETFSATSIIECADVAAKAAEVKLFRVHLSMAIGGKGFLLLSGEVGAVRAAIEAGVVPAARRGLLASKIVIPSPREELFSEYI
ncbi:MAG: BMC domain-containing protein [Candidatus Eremiobacteraeota bacterium]|nr:BMC domain-containing protein [Candidatus Eremiobacteraeota bacterium]